ncbi:MAG: preprotein translocase subunit SecY [Puniceicoccales bacterium]|jgi:preprotein translocase subunit SecY|nr:preprotein translocase subunit SecY [Puniceicoccales bacterium]
MLSAFVDCIKVPDLRRKILFTLALLFVARVGASIPLPGLDPKPLHDFFATQAGSGSSLIGLYNMFTGGAFLKGAIFGLGVMPYISASIILQLMSAVVPTLARVQKDQNGRQRIAQYTRYLTVLICLIQGILLVLALMNYPEKLFTGFNKEVYGEIVVMNRAWFLINSTIFLTAGTMILTWLGDRITQNGIGNGISLLITIGILSSLPRAISQTWAMFYRPVGVEGTQYGLFQAVLMLALLLTVMAAMISMTQATRKIPVQYAKRIIGHKVYGGQTSFLPLKVNYAGIMPVIFASAILLFPQQIFAYLGAATGVSLFQRLSYILMHGSWFYYLSYGTMILGFSYFWVSIMFRPTQIADDLKKNGGYIPGVRPGAATAEFLDFTMTRLTLAGAIFLTVIALFPDFLYFSFHIPYTVAMFFGGTGTLITVGVILETMKQMETHLLEKQYDGFLQKGKARGKASSKRFSEMISSLLQVKSLWIFLGILALVGSLAWWVHHVVTP